MATDNLHALDQWLEEFIQRLSPAQSRVLATTIARQLRTQQAQNIQAQRGPDGSPWAPRKKLLRSARGSIRSKAQAAQAGSPMFRKLGTRRHLQARATPQGALVAFAARSQRIARVHHFGLTDRVNKKDGPLYPYPARPLLGLSDESRALITQLLIQHLRV